jgi:hypothetical protein
MTLLPAPVLTSVRVQGVTLCGAGAGAGHDERAEAAFFPFLQPRHHAHEWSPLIQVSRMRESAVLNHARPAPRGGDSFGSRDQDPRDPIRIDTLDKRDQSPTASGARHLA